MPIEIERKFLLKNEGWQTADEGTLYRQGYIVSGVGKVVRIRVAGSTGFITIKGSSQEGLLSRSEYEYEIPLPDANEMLDTLCESGIIEKRRHKVKYGNHVWEIDVFAGNNTGLVVAEIELQAEDEAFDIPDWIGDEVTDDPRYANSQLAKVPYNQWG